MTERRDRSRRTRILLWAAVAVVLAFALVRAFRPSPVLVDTAEVRRGTMRVTVEEDGRTRVRERFTVSAPVEGLLLRTPLDPGDAVRAGESVVAEFLPVTPSPLDVRSRREAQARLARAVAALEENEARRAQVAAELRFARAELERARRLHAEGIQAREALERAERDERTAAEALRAADRAVDVARYEVEIARATLLEARAFDADALRIAPPPAAPAERGELVEPMPSVPAPEPQDSPVRREDPPAKPGSSSASDRASPADRSGAAGEADSPQFLEASEGRLLLRSPVDGHVLRVFEESARTLAAGAPILEIGDTRELEIVADYLSQDAVKIRPGMDVLVEGWGGQSPGGLEEVLHGVVRLVEPAGFTKVSALGVEEQRVNVIVDPLGDPKAWEAIGDGYRVELAAVLWQGDDVVVVPTGALFREGEAWAVFVVESGRARLREVEIGHLGDLDAEAVAGLAPGERVVMYPSELISDGSRIEPR